MANPSNTPTTNAGTLPIANLITVLILGALTIDRGLMRVVMNSQDKVELGTFDTDADLLVDRVETPSVSGDNMHKGKIIINQGDFMAYDEMNPMTQFDTDWRDYWATGKMTEAQVSPRIRRAILETYTPRVLENLEKLIWQGDTAGATHLSFFDGFQKLLTASGTVNKVTDLTVAIDKSNIIGVLDAMIATAPDAVLEKGNVGFTMSHRDKQIYYSALRDASISKGTNLQDGGVDTYAGIKIVSCGIAKNKILLHNQSTGEDANLVGATWMSQDYNSLQIEKLQANSELWFVKVLAKFGVNMTNEAQMVYYDGTVA